MLSCAHVCHMRLLLIFLSIALLGNATAQTFGLYTYTVNPDNVSVTITDYPTNATGAIEIPATIDGRSVTSIGSLAFYQCSGLTQRHHSRQRHQHREYAFWTALPDEHHHPDSVTSIGLLRIPELQQPDERHHPEQRHQHRAAHSIVHGLTSSHPRQRHQHRVTHSIMQCLTSITIPNSVTSIGNTHS